VHLLVVMTAERGLCGGFNSSIAKLARKRIDTAQGRGQDGEDPDRRQEGPRAAEARYADLFVGHVDLSDVKRVGYADAAESRAKCWTMFDAGEFDVARSSSTASSR
jgi:F-type H+-transporting ATPase subunit gamma